MAKKYIPIEDVEARVEILQIAQMLGLEIKPSGAQFRCQCPVHGGDHRSLCVSPQVRSRRGSLGVFFCQSEKTGGDRVGLVAHIMEIGQQDAIMFLAEQLGMETASSNTVTSNTVDSTSANNAPSPAKKASEKVASKPPTQFDPAAFAQKLEYTDEVQALGYTEQEARSFGIGAYRGAVYKAARYASGSTAGYWKYQDAKWVAPKQWLPDTSNVVQLKRPA